MYEEIEEFFAILDIVLGVKQDLIISLSSEVKNGEEYSNSKTSLLIEILSCIFSKDIGETFSFLISKMNLSANVSGIILIYIGDREITLNENNTKMVQHLRNIMPC